MITTRGKVAVVMGASTGSEGKGNIAAWAVKKELPDVLMSACSRNASHTVLDSSLGIRYVFKVLPCGAAFWGRRKSDLGSPRHRYDDSPYRPHIFIGPGSAFTPTDLLKEIKDFNIPVSNVHIHPIAGIVTDADIGYENGVMDWEGRPIEVDHGSGTSRFGTTGSGSGACRARKALRKALVARDVPELSEMVRSDFEGLLVSMTEEADGAILDGSQGHLLSNYSSFYPHCTSRSTSLAQFLSDMQLPVSLCGNVLGVARTHPIRINSRRYWHSVEKRFLTWSEAQAAGAAVEEVDADSGSWFDDQREITWEELSERLGRTVEPELTTLTKLPRRIATFSHESMRSFFTLNTPPAPYKVFLCLTFTNYLNDGDRDQLLKEVWSYSPPLSEFLLSDSAELEATRRVFGV